jgi:hypothetical protein
VSFTELTKEKRIAKVRRMAAKGMTRAEMAEALDVKCHVIDSTCAAGSISTLGQQRRSAPQHPGWDRDENKRRAWFIQMGQRFAAALRREGAAS